MSKLIVNEIEKYDAGQLTITTGTNVSIGSDLTVGGALGGTLSTAAQPNVTSVGTLTGLTVSGNLTVDTNTLFVDSANNSVGIGTSTPSPDFSLDAARPIRGEYFALRSNSSAPAQSVFIYRPETGVLGFGTANTERMRIDSSGNVGIGTSSPTSDVHLVRNVNGDVDLRIQNANAGSSATATLNIDASGNNFKIINYPDADTPNANRTDIGSTAGGSYLTFTTANTERMRILSSGGITFNGDTAAANALDDYEEGTFTPTAFGSTTAGTTTYSARNGYYTKIGRKVSVNIYINYTNLTGTGNLQIGGLPFTSANLTQNIAVGSFLSSNLNWSGGTFLTSVQVSNTNKIEIIGSSDDGSQTVQQCVNEAALLRASVTYFV